jgi:hypothetical protein
MTLPEQRFQPLLRQLRRRAWGRNLIIALAAGLLVAGVLRAVRPESAILVGAGVTLLLLIVGRLRGAAWRINSTRLAAHLDRRFPELEESAELLLADPAGLPTLQRLQRARVEPRWAVVATTPSRWLPRRRMTTPLLLALLGALLFLGSPYLVTLLERTSQAVTTATPFFVDVVAPTLENVSVEPPPYTGLPRYSLQGFDIEVAEGAVVTWRFEYGGTDTVRLVVGDGDDRDRHLPLEPGDDGALTVSMTVRRTALYRLERLTPEGAEPLPGVHTLSVIPDRPPRLRVLEPNQTRLEIARDGPTDFAYRVSVIDDHGVASVEIRASVAKGSGEGVKFRDESFAFERETREGGASVFERNWSLGALGMEPGDEIYFFTVARDNRPGEANEARSETVVVRWLDEAIAPEWAEGLAIDVMPEYFKSQRQIIIETEQLIADRDQLSTEVFEATSRDLGQAQSDLKERYGQYLGDEFDEGGSPFAMGVGEEGEGHDDHETSADEHDEEGHDHEGAVGPDTTGSADELIARFAHEHGTANIGPITRRNPVGLMKRSIANMWQAELHLRLADPESALPFEYEALKYLDLARQADRIYTRRLGFEPPPVSEERRLTGELDDIQNRRWRRQAEPDPSSQDLLQGLHRLLSTIPRGADFTEDQRDLLRRAARLFTDRAQQRPALIRQAASLEMLRVAGRLEIPDCEDCLDALKTATWSLMPRAEPGPGPGHRPSTDDQAREYLQRLEALRQEQGSASTADTRQGSAP